MDFAEYLERQKQRVDRTLDALLPAPDGAGAARTVALAMRYAIAGGGKRLRPILVLAASEACGSASATVLEPAAAVEMIHTYSLIHDDLPAMDDDDLRRGQPTVHRAFGEAEAILAGDALLTLAFEVLGCWPAGPDLALQRGAAVVRAAQGAGLAGMVGGQIADLEAQGTAVDPGALSWIHRHKTGALFSASAEIGAIHGGASEQVQSAFASYGAALGLAFQIADDVLDCTGTAFELGKTPGKDERSGKATYPALLGLAASRSLASQQVEQALEALRPVGLLSGTLEALATYAVSRTR